jgi:hypothetical protein
VLEKARGGACPANHVHYARNRGVGDPFLSRMPWVEASPRGELIGALAYYGSTWFGRGHLPRARVYEHGTKGDGHVFMQVFWLPLTGHYGPNLLIDGRRLNRPGTMQVNSFPDAVPLRYASFPTGLSIPSPGCWRIRLRTAGVSFHVTFLVLRQP